MLPSSQTNSVQQAALGPEEVRKSSPTHGDPTLTPRGDRKRRFEAESTHTSEEPRWPKSSATSSLRRWLGFPGLPLCSSSPQPQPPRPRPLSAPRLPSQISLTMMNRLSRFSSTVRDRPRPRQRLLFESRRRHLPRLGLRPGTGSDSWLPDSFFGSWVSQQLPRRTSRQGRERGPPRRAGNRGLMSASSLSTQSPENVV